MAANNDNDKVVEWHKSGWTYFMVIAPVMLFLLVFCVDYSDSGSAGNTSAKSERGSDEGESRRSYPGIPADVVHAADSDEQLFFEDGAKVVRCDVPVGSWSAEIITPIESRNYRLDVKPDKTVFYVKFSDGSIEKIGGGEKRFKDVKIRRGIMRLYGTVPGQRVTVAID